MSAKDITGQRFGRLITLKPSQKRSGSGSVFWDCLCDCGNIANVNGKSLRAGHTKSCGCSRKGVNIIDIVGKRFGRLLVLNLVEKRYVREAIWKCRCDCGNITFTGGKNLRLGRTKSCGCLRNEITSQRSLNRLVGQKIDMLLVLELLPKRSRTGSAIWRCRCDCGNLVSVSGEELTRRVTRTIPRTKSCGCMRYATYFAKNTNIDPCCVPIEVIRCLQAKNELRKAIKQAS